MLPPRHVGTTAACFVAMLFVLLALAPPAHAYRPFISTDAAVADPKTVEIELGYLNFERDRSRDTFRVPGIVLNYGLIDRLEIVGEFRLEEGPRGGVEVTDPGVFLKGVVKEGVLQEKRGLSIAIELGPLLPSTIEGERGVGFEGVTIVSTRLEPFTFHVNGGGGLTRSELLPFAFWGVIGELPVARRFRVVGEVTGESVEGQRPNNSALIGAIWQPTSTDLFFDVGLRRGLTRDAADWQVTVGLTYAFSVEPLARGLGSLFGGRR